MYSHLDLYQYPKITRKTPAHCPERECAGVLLTRKPQAMLVDEKSTSVETVKKEPPFATIEAGNANRTKAKGGSSIWTKKVYHIGVGIANIT